MRRLLPVCFSLAVFVLPKAFGDEQSTSPYATAADFAKYAMKLREQALLKVEPQVFIPSYRDKIHSTVRYRTTM